MQNIPDVLRNISDKTYFLQSYLTPTKPQSRVFTWTKKSHMFVVQVISFLFHSDAIHQIDTGRKILDKIFINEGVRQGCNLSLALFNIYVDDLPSSWKHKADSGIVLKRNLYLNTLLFADDQVIMQDSEDKLQKSIY